MRRFAHFSKFLFAGAASLAMILGISQAASATPALISSIGTVSASNYTVISPDGTRLYAMSQNSKQLVVIDTSTNTVLNTYLLAGITTSQVVYLTISPDGSKLYASGYEGGTSNPAVPASAIFVIDLTSNPPAVTNTIDLGTSRSMSIVTIAGSAITPDGTKLFVALPKDNKVAVIDTGTNSVTTQFTLASQANSSYTMVYPSRIAVTPNGSTYFVAYSALPAGITGASGIASLRVSDNYVNDIAEFGVRDSGASPATLPTACPWGLTVSSDGHTLYASSTGTTGAAWLKEIGINNNGSFGTTFTTATVPLINPGDIRLSADDTLLYMAGYQSYFLVYRTSNLLTTPTFIPLMNTNVNTMIAPSREYGAHTAYVGSLANNVYFVGEYIGPRTQVLTETAGTAFTSAAMTATGLPGTVTYSISPGLPAGLSFNAATGVISGTATSPLARTDFTITATNGSATATALVTLTVTAGSGGGGSSPAPSPAASPTNLASTGSNVAPITIAAGVLLVSGALILRRRRRRLIR